MKYISLDIINKCLICNQKLEDIKVQIGRKPNKYNIWYFLEHLKLHSISILDYLIKYEKLNIPKCECGICNQDSYPTTKGKFLYWRSYICGRYSGTLEWAKKAKETRKGSGNPMYKKKAWNKDIDKNSEYSKKMSSLRLGTKCSKESKQKMSDSAKNRKNHGHTGCKHTEENKQKFRENTLRMIKEGKYPQTRSLPHQKFANYLDKAGIEYIEEVINGSWCFDFYIPKLNLYIEIDGDYFHSNPNIYPNGPKTKTQKINWYRDIKKNEFCVKNNIQLIRFWENEVLNYHQKIQDFICQQKKLLE